MAEPDIVDRIRAQLASEDYELVDLLDMLEEAAKEIERLREAIDQDRMGEDQ